MPRLLPSAHVFASLLWTLPGAVALTSVAHAQTAPREALVVASRDMTLTLGVGTDDGAKIGQTFRVVRGRAGATIQITALTASQSTAAVIRTDPGFVIAVGDTATFLREEALQPPVEAAPTAPGASLPQTPAAGEGVATPAGSNPSQALLTSVSGNRATLGIGVNDGATVGAVYALPLSGNVKARLQITQVRPSDSVAAITIIEEGFVPTVGDVTRFLRVQELPEAPSAPVETPATPAIEVNPPSVDIAPATPLEVPTPAPRTPSVSLADSGVRASPAPVAALSGATATVTEIKNGVVTISAGNSQGAKAAQNVPILRGGQIIGLLRLQTVSDNSSSGVVLYRDESLAPIAPGDAVGLLGASPEVGAPQNGPVLAQAPAVGGAFVPYETGAPNFAVPKANPTYELLAALASSGLIRSQPPGVFQDDGARRHRSAEDITFSRAQVAGFIREAMGNSDDELKGRSRAALSILTKEFRRDLMALGETEATLEPYTSGRGFGVSGFTRYTAAAGQTDVGTRDPFSESYGARRSRTGID